MNLKLEKWVADAIIPKQFIELHVERVYFHCYIFWVRRLEVLEVIRTMVFFFPLLVESQFNGVIILVAWLFEYSEYSYVIQLANAIL